MIWNGIVESDYNRTSEIKKSDKYSSDFFEPKIDILKSQDETNSWQYW